MKNNPNTIELLNAEGPILIAEALKHNRGKMTYTLTLVKSGHTWNLDIDQMTKFINGETDLVYDIFTENRKEINYLSEPADMKPSVDRLMSFLAL